MENLIAEVLKSARVQVLIFLFLLSVVLLPTYMAYRIETAVIALTNKLDCGAKITIAASEAGKAVE